VSKTHDSLLMVVCNYTYSDNIAYLLCSGSNSRQNIILYVHLCCNLYVSVLQ